MVGGVRISRENHAKVELAAITGQFRDGAQPRRKTRGGTENDDSRTVGRTRGEAGDHGVTAVMRSKDAKGREGRMTA